MPFAGMPFSGMMPQSNANQRAMMPQSNINPNTGLFSLSPQSRRQNLFQAMIPAGLGLIAASGPSTDPGAFSKGLAATGQNFFTNTNALNNQAMQRNILNYNMQRQAAAAKLAQEKAERDKKLFPLQMDKARRDAKGNPFGTSNTGYLMQIWSAANAPGADPALKETPDYKLAVSVLSNPRVINTPQGAVTIPASMSPSGIPYGAGNPQASATGATPPSVPPTTVPRPAAAVTSQTAKQKLNLTPAEEAIDGAFAKQYTGQVISGSQADFDKNLATLNIVYNQLGKRDDLTGSALGKTPVGIREIVAQDSVDVQEQVEEVVQRNLRIILGAQFTEKEGDRLIRRAYNVNLPEAVNQVRLKRLIDAMTATRAAQMAAAKYYEKYGTLKGFKGTSQFNLQLIERRAGLTPGQTDEDIGPPPAGVSLQDWREMTPTEREEF